MKTFFEEKSIRSALSNFFAIKNTLKEPEGIFYRFVFNARLSNCGWLVMSFFNEMYYKVSWGVKEPPENYLKVTLRKPKIKASVEGSELHIEIQNPDKVKIDDIWHMFSKEDIDIFHWIKDGYSYLIYKQKIYVFTTESNPYPLEQLIKYESGTYEEIYFTDKEFKQLARAIKREFGNDFVVKK